MPEQSNPDTRILPPVPPGVYAELARRADHLTQPRLDDARDWVEERLDTGADCPCCGQHAQEYRRKLHATMAADLVRMTRRFGVGRAFHVRDLGRHPGDFAKLALWGLIADTGDTRGDGGRAGYWKVTTNGARFVAGHLRVPKYVRLYAGRVIGWGDGQINVEEALAGRFDLRELRGAFHWPADESGRITVDRADGQTTLLDELGAAAA